MKDQIVLNRADITELIDVLELKLELVKEYLPELKKETAILKNLLTDLKTETNKSQNIGKTLKEIDAKLNTFKNDFKEFNISKQEIRILEKRYKELGNKLIIAYSLLGFFLGILLTYMVGI